MPADYVYDDEELLDRLVAESASKTPEDFRVVGLEKVQQAYAMFNGTMYAGMLSSSHEDRKSMTMFWMFESETQAVDDTLVMWLNGGP
jgi:carboxypeptidase C (cathepsin A)